MKKVLLVGKLNNTIKELYEGLSRRFQVQIAVDQWKVVEGMVNIVNPDMLVLNITELDDFEENIFKVVERAFADLPVIVIGSEEAFGKYAKYLEREQMIKLKRPLSKQVLIQTCYQAAGTEGAKAEAIEAEEIEKKKILVVDDSPVTLRSIKAMLDKNYQIAVATSGEQALRTIQKNRPDLILLDYEMPGWSGKETLENIRADEAISDIPVIFLTGVADKEHIAAVLKLKPAGYFLKPAERDKLIEAIEAVVNKGSAEEDDEIIE